MNYSEQIKILKSRIKQLQEISDTLYDIEETIIAIENEVSSLDSSLPSDESIRRMNPGTEKKQILELLDLCEKVYGMVDDIIGPPDNAVPFDKSLYFS